MEFLESTDNNLAYYERFSNLVCATLKDHLVGRAQDWFEVIGYSYVHGPATDFAQLKEALTENFPIVTNGSELEKALKLDMTEEKLLDHFITRLDPQVIDYGEVRNSTTKTQLLQLVAKYEEKHASRGTQGSINNVGGQDLDSRRRVPDRRRDGN
ncbi:uncharacterized protein TNCV_1159151 [Trichonephila clavipes]|nr:uncharacterized protein TNCV_1159151 [Trichonephila clavipes]